MGVVIAILITWPTFLILDTWLAIVVMVGSAIAMGIVGNREPVFTDRS